MKTLPILLLSLAAASSGASAETRNKVDYMKVLGESCLRPVVRSSSAGLGDYKAAERRWLDANYPGYEAWNWTTVIVYPEDQDGTVVDVGTVQEESAYVQAADGSSFKVCFQVGAKMHAEGDDDDDAPPDVSPNPALMTNLLERGSPAAIDHT